MPDLALPIWRCERCGASEGAPRPICPKCGGQLAAAFSPGAGRLYSWTMVRRPPLAFADRPPYPVAVVDLDEEVRVTGRLASVEPEPRLGSRVRLLAVEDGVGIFG